MKNEITSLVKDLVLDLRGSGAKQLVFATFGLPNEISAVQVVELRKQINLQLPGVEVVHDQSQISTSD